MARKLTDKILTGGIVMRALLVSAMVLAGGAPLAADDKKEEKIDAKKLVGKWAVPPLNDTPLLEFAKDGKVQIKLFQNVGGTYKVEGNKLTLKLKVGNNDDEMILTITKLTDTELVTKDKDGKEEKFERFKDK